MQLMLVLLCLSTFAWTVVAAPPTPATDHTPRASVLPEPVLLAQESRRTEGRLRKVINELQQGTPNYDDMEPALRAAVRQQLPMVVQKLKGLGAVRSIKFEGEQQGGDVYDVQFERGGTVWMIALSPGNKIMTLVFR
jgi:hypothetical protein